MTNKKRGRPPKKRGRGRPKKEKDNSPKLKVHWVEIGGIDSEQQKLIFSQNCLNWAKALRKYGMKKAVRDKKYRKYADTLVELSGIVMQTVRVPDTGN